MECRDQRRIVAVCDFDSDMRRSLGRRAEIEGRWGDRRDLEVRRMHSDEDLEIDRAVVVRLVERDAAMGRVRWYVPGNVCVNGSRIIVVVGVLVDVRVQEGRVHRTALHGHRQAECQNPTNHRMILLQNRPPCS